MAENKKGCNPLQVFSNFWRSQKFCHQKVWKIHAWCDQGSCSYGQVKTKRRTVASNRNRKLIIWKTIETLKFCNWRLPCRKCWKKIWPASGSGTSAWWMRWVRARLSGNLRKEAERWCVFSFGHLNKHSPGQCDQPAKDADYVGNRAWSNKKRGTV